MRKNIFYEKKLVFLLSVLKICLPLQRKRKNKRCNRNVAQLVAHYVRDVGVGRSSRLIPTQKRSDSQQELDLFCYISVHKRQYFSKSISAWLTFYSSH